MGYTICDGCGCEIYIPPELDPDSEGEKVAPYYCDECERLAESAADIDTTEYCSHCGKDIEDFSDLGCEHCDRRYPGDDVLVGKSPIETGRELINKLERIKKAIALAFGAPPAFFRDRFYQLRMKKPK